MSQLNQIFASLTTKQKVSIGAAILVAGALITGLLHLRKEGDFKPLYTGLAPEDASAIVQKLKEGGVEYRLADNGATVLTPSARSAETRLLLAGAGLPKSGRLGFELFDKTNFGMTDFTEHVNYRRALEGELERSILSLADVEQARVHVTFPKESVFVESREPAKASVMLRLRGNVRLNSSSVRAISHLVASAVEGLQPDAVSVLDNRGNLLNRPRLTGPGDESSYSDAQLEYRQNLERDILTKVNQTLEPILGAGRFRAGVAVECDYATREESEEVLDPTKSVMLTSQRSEENTATSASAGVPGTASNLPNPTSRPASPGGGAGRRTENVTYQASRTVRHVKTPKGVLKRMSVAVLVDHTVRIERNGQQTRRIVTPPPPETIKVIKDLVAGVVGIDAQRGDQIMVDTLPFESTLQEDSVETARPAAPAPPKSVFQEGVSGFLRNPWMAGLAVIVGLMLLLLKRKRPSATARAPIALPVGEKSALPASAMGPIGEAPRVAALEEATGPAQGPPAPRMELLTQRLAEEVKKDTRVSARALRSWMVQERA